MSKLNCIKRWFGTMVDCSRNAVLTVEAVKDWIDLSVDMGYNMLMLYTEDTYEIKSHPYFGYCRGRYSMNEMKEINAYAISKGIELIPCIQTLAHLNAITRWPAYAPLIDQNDVLLVGDERVYQFIDDMFASITEACTSKYVHVGMDEARGLGRGQYYDIHGDCELAEMFIGHLIRVAEIAKKYGKNICVWGDTFHTLMSTGKHDDLPENFDNPLCDRIPDNVELVCWEYHSTSAEFYDRRIKSHNKIKEGTWFAGTFRSWIGYAPHNKFSISTIKPVIEACRKNDVGDIFFTIWGDNGGECSKFAMLPTMFYASEVLKGNLDEDRIHKAFGEKFGVAWDDFMLLDLPDSPNGRDVGLYDSDKYLLFNDLFMGTMDSTLDGSEGIGFAECARKLRAVPHNDRWGYLFETQAALSEVLAIKANLGTRTREAYRTKDKEALAKVIAEYERLEEKLAVFYEAYRKQWYKENKGHGFDVQDIRLGGLRQRVCHCREMLKEYQAGTITRIDELEEKLLDFTGNGEQLGQKTLTFKNWNEIATANVL